MIVFIAAVAGFFIYFCVVLLFFGRGERADVMSRRLSSVINVEKKNTLNDDELSKPLMERFIKPFIQKQVQLLGRMIPHFSKNKDSQSRSKREKKLQSMLYRAGLGISAAEFRFIRMMVTIGFTLLYILLAFLSRAPSFVFILAALFGVYSGFSAVRFYLTGTAAKRKKAMEEQMPDMLDLLSVSVEAGLGFEQAVYQIISHFEGPLIDELAVTYREMSMGRTRRDALILLGDRCDLEELKSFVGALVQASQLGISMKNVLRAQASAMRQARRNKIEEKAMKISVKILIPMVVFIFPVIFIVLLGPAVIGIMEVMG